MKTIFTRLRVLGLCLFALHQTQPLPAIPTDDPNCSTNISLKQSEGSGGDCPEEAILVIKPAELNSPFGQDLLVRIHPGNLRVRLDKDANSFTMPIQPGKYTFTTSAIGSPSCGTTTQELEIIKITTLYDIQFEQYNFSCTAQAPYKVGISPAFDRETFGLPMKISLLPSGQVFDVTANSNAFLLALPAGQYQLISESPTDPNCRSVQNIEVKESNGMDDQAPIFSSSFCDSYSCSTTPTCLNEIHYFVEATDNCGPVTITNNLNDQEGSSFADLFGLGSHELIFTATDQAGNQSHCKVNFSLSFEGTPNAFCVANTVVKVGEESERYLTMDEIAITNPSGEFCDELFVIDPPYLSCEDVGTQTIKVFQKGNPTPLCETNISVESSYDFVLDCHASTYAANENRDGVCGTEVLVEIDIESSGCSQGFTIRNDRNSIEGSEFTEFFPIGVHQVTFYLEQDGALITSCTKTIQVQEDPTGLACLQACLPEIDREGSTYEFNAANESWELGSQENALLAQEDDITFISFPMNGDGSIVAKVSQMSQKARAGVMMRENCNPGSRFIAALLKPFSRNAYQRHRSEAYASSQQLQKRMTGGYPKWVKLKRKGNSFYSYASKNGYSWRLLFKTTMPMGEEMQWGLMVESSTINTYATATFVDIGINGQASGRFANSNPNLNHANQGYLLGVKNEKEQEQLSVYPNPSNGQISLKFPNWKGESGQIEVLDISGKVIRQIPVNELFGQTTSFDWQNLHPGIYLISLKQNGRAIITKRLLIQP